jgi:hypothetical protein
MTIGLIGHTGFVGSSLSAAAVFDQTYNSVNFREMIGRSFDVLVCAGVSAAKWLANRDPQDDRQKIVELMETLRQTSTREFVLISTVDVYPDPACGGDEDFEINPASNHAYGRHRLELEQWAARTFPRCRILRLPALFGPNLRKNALYDLVHDNLTAAINPAGVFQWYPIARLWSDIEITRRADLSLVNLVTEPVRMSSIIERYFPGVEVGHEQAPAPTYNLTTRYSTVFGGEGPFIQTADECLRAIGDFVRREKRI